MSVLESPLSRSRALIGSAIALALALALAACGTVQSPDAPPDAACTPAWKNILVNGDFEKGHISWTEDPADPPSICSKGQLTLATHDGNFSTCMGLHDFRVQSLSQELALPAGTSRVRLRGYRCLVTSETGDAALDTMTLALTDPVDERVVVADLGTWSNGDARPTCQWVQFEQMADLTDAPARATLRFHSRLNDSHVTSFYLDTLTLDAFACP